MSEITKNRQEVINERSHKADQCVRKYKLMFSEVIWKEKEFKTIAEILEEADIPRHHYNNVTNPDKLKPGSESNDDEKKGRPYSLPMEWPLKVAWAFNDHSLLVEQAKDAGGLYLTPTELKELDTIDPADTDKIGKVLKKLKSIAGAK